MISGDLDQLGSLQSRPQRQVIGTVQFHDHRKVGADARADGAVDSRSSLTRFASEPPYWSVRRLVYGVRNWLIKYPCPPWISMPSKPAVLQRCGRIAESLDDALDLRHRQRARARAGREVRDSEADTASGNPAKAGPPRGRYG